MKKNIELLMHKYDYHCKYYRLIQDPQGRPHWCYIEKKSDFYHIIDDFLRDTLSPKINSRPVYFEEGKEVYPKDGDLTERKNDIFIKITLEEEIVAPF